MTNTTKLALAALAVSAATANAEIVIDDWSVDQGPYTGSAWDITQEGSMLSGLRRVFQQNVGGAGEVFGEVSDDRLRFSSENGGQNFFTTYWDGPNRQGTVPYDFTEGGQNDRFRLDIYQTNGASSALILIKTTAGTFHSVNFPFEARVGAWSAPVEIMFSEFDDNPDFTSIEFVALDLGIRNFDGAATDVSVGTFRIVPAPSSLLALSTLGLAATRRRR